MTKVGDRIYYWARREGERAHKKRGRIISMDKTGALARVRLDHGAVPVQLVMVSRLIPDGEKETDMKLQFRITFRSGSKVVAEVLGLEDKIDASRLSVEEVTAKVIETEQFLEKLTGLRVHIEQVD